MNQIEENIKKHQLEAHKNKVWQEYSKWRENPVYCPALKEKVNFTLRGWKHTVGEDKKRTIDDIQVRLRMMSKVREIIEKSNFMQDVESFDGKIRYSFIAVEMLKEESGSAYTKLFVIVEKDSYGNLTFLSVFRRRPRL